MGSFQSSEGKQDFMQQCQKTYYYHSNNTGPYNSLSYLLPPPTLSQNTGWQLFFILNCLQNSWHVPVSWMLLQAFLGTPASTCFGGSEFRCNQLWSSLKGQGNSRNVFSTSYIQLYMCECVWWEGCVCVYVCVCIDFIYISIYTHMLLYI